MPSRPGLPAAGGIMRPRLHLIMSGEVHRLGANMRTGRYRRADRGQRGGASRDAQDGSRAEPATLSIGADGLLLRGSRVLFPDAVEPVYTGQMSWRVVRAAR